MNDERKRLKELYNNLKADNYDLPEYGTFERDMADDNLMRQLYDNIKADNYDVPDYETFRGDMGYGSYQQPAEQPQGLPVNPATFAPMAQPQQQAPNVRAPFANEEAQRQYEQQRAAAQPKPQPTQEQAQPLGPERFQKQMEMQQAVGKMQADFNKRLDELRNNYNPFTTPRPEGYDETPEGKAYKEYVRQADARDRVWGERHLRMQGYNKDFSTAAGKAWDIATEQSGKEQMENIKAASRFSYLPGTGSTLMLQNKVAHLKNHDMELMTNNAWQALGKEKQDAIIEDYYQQLVSEQARNAGKGEGEGTMSREEAERILREQAEQMAKARQWQAMYDKAVEMNAPKSVLEFMGRKIVEGNTISKLVAGAARVMAGTRGDMEARDVAMQNYERDGHRGYGIAADVLQIATDPVTYVSGGAGGAVTKAVAKGVEKKVAAETLKRGGQTLTTRILEQAPRVAGGATNFALFESLGNAGEQARMGGVYDPETGEYTFDMGEIGKAASRGLLLGSAGAVTGGLIGNVGNKVYKNVGSTGGKLAVRGAEAITNDLAMGTIFAAPELISGEGDFDTWLDNVEMMAAFRLSHGAKAIPQRFEQLRKNPESRAGFETRLRTMLDRQPGLALTSDEAKELNDADYNDLKQLVEAYKSTDGKLVVRGEDMPYNRFEELMNDKNISKAAKAKMYYYVTGKLLPQPTVVDVTVTTNRNADGKVQDYTVETKNEKGEVITRRSFNSENEANVEFERMARQAEMNGIELLEQQYDQVSDDNTTSKMLRDVIGKETGVDIDKAIGKEPNRRSEKEQAAIDEYTKAMLEGAYGAWSRAGRNASRKMIEGPYKDGYDADEQQRSDIAIEAADGKEGAEEAWRGVVQRINDDADMMAAQQREESRKRQFRGEGENKGALRPVTITTKNGEQREVYLTQGELALTESGLVDPEKTKELNNVGTLTAYDPVEGKEVSFAPSDIVEVGQMTTAEQQEQNIETNKQAYIQQQQDAATGRFNPQPGQQIEVPDMGTATVLATDGETVTLQMPDGTQQSMAIADIQQIADGVAMEDYRQRHPEAEQPSEPATEAKGAPETFSDGMMLTVRDDEGNEQQMEVIGRASYSAQPGSAGYREDPNGGYVALFVPGEEQPRYIREDKLREQTVDYREQEAEQPAAEVEQPAEDAAEQSTAGGAVPAGESAETAAAPAVAPEVEIYNNVKGEYPEAYRDKVENTVKIKAKRVADTKTALDKASAALTATEYGSKEEATAKQKRDKAQQAYDAAVADSEMWSAVKSLKDQELLAEREAKDAVEREERERRRAETEAARKREQEAYEAEMARRKAEQEEKNRRTEAALENMAKMRDEAAAVGADFPIEDDADAMEVMNDLEPHTLEEVAAWLLSDTKGKMKIDPEEMRKHTGYSSTDMNKFPFIFKKDGVSPEKYGEHIEQIARENGVPFNEADTNVGFNALLNVLGEVGGLGDLKNYIKDARRKQAERLHSQNVARAAAVQTEDDWIAQHGGMSREEYASYINWMEDAVEQGKTEITDEEFNQIFNTDDTRTATTDEESQRGGAAESGTDGAEARQAATAADDTRRGGEDAVREGAAEVTARTEGADTPLKSLAEVKKFMETIGYKASLSRVFTDDNGRKFVKYYASGNITPNIYLGETTPFDIWQQFNLYGNNIGVDIPADIKAELDRVNEDARGAREALWAEDREQVKDLLTEAGIPFYDVIDSERGSRIVFTDRKNDNGNYVDYMDVADVDQAREDIAFVREKAERVNKQAAYQTEAEKAVTDIAEQLDNGRTAKNDELIQRIADMEADAEQRLEDDTLSDDERARMQAQYDAASKWMDDNVRSQKGMPAAPTAEQKTLTKGLVGWLNGIGIKTHAAVRKGQEVLNKYRELVRSLRAYHGSGADFDAFDHSHMGEGEGAQAYGYGTYVTEVEGIGRTYAEDNSRNVAKYKGNENIPNDILDRIESAIAAGWTFNRIWGYWRDMAKSERERGDEKSAKEYESWAYWISRLSPSDFERKKNRILYTVEIPDDNGSNYLEWDKKQNKDVREKIQRAVDDAGQKHIIGHDADGQRIYEELAGLLGSDKAASEFLHNAGFVGIKYPSQFSSGGRGDKAKNYVIFDEGDLKITDKIRFQRAADGEYEPKPVFYSNAMNAVEGIKQEKATAEQWLAMLQKNGGLKAGEDKWIGLSDWLNDHKGKSLTKQEVMDYIRENQIQVEEVEYANNGDYSKNPRIKELRSEYEGLVAQGNKEELKLGREFIAFEDEMIEKYGSGWIDKINETERRHYDELTERYEAYKNPEKYAMAEMVSMYGDDFELAFETGIDGLQPVTDYYSGKISEAAKYYLGINENDINETRLNYTTDGLDNKREIALTIPTIEPWNKGDDVHFGDAGEGRAVAWVRFGDAYLPADGGAARREFERIMEDNDRWYAAHPKFTKYGIANEGEDLEALKKENEERKARQREALAASNAVPNTTKVLVVDEIQSNRHQQGREKGYRKESTSELIKKQGELERRRIDMVREFQKTHPDDVNNEAWDAFVNSKEYKDILKEESETEDKIRASYNLIPDAPFDKNWHEVAFKRMLRYAAENGYDKVAWTKGDQQAERYNIGNAVERIYIGNANGRRYVNIKPKDEKVISIYYNDNGIVTAVSDGTYSDFRNKPLSDVLGKELALKVMSSSEGTTIEGEGLRIGSEGMKGFYDQILPRFADKYGKKWNVKTTDIDLPNIGDNGLTMHSVDVTPEMKASVLEGQPMFFRDKDGEVIGYTLNGEIYIDPRYAKPETPVHEYTHLIVHAIRANNSQVWERWKQLAHGEQDVIDFVKAKYPEYSENEDDFWEEVISNYTGREGGKRLEDEMRKQMRETPDIVEKARIATIFHKLRDLLKRFWDMTKDIFSGSTNGIDNFKSMDDVVDLTLAALANKYDPRATQKAATEARDKEYMEAVEKGDMEKAQRMVMEAAKDAMPDTKVVDENGNPLVVYHGSPKKTITTFERERAGEHTNAYGDKAIYATDDEGVADEFSHEMLPGSTQFTTILGEKGKVYPLYMDIKRPFDIRDVENSKELQDVLKSMPDIGDGEFFDSLMRAIKNGNHQLVKTFIDFNKLEELGYDGIIARMYTYESGKDALEYGVFSPEQIKSADPVTYDDNGNVIPLSKRFNSRNADIRFQFAGERGAAAADKAEEVTHRMDNLGVARQMESSGKDAKAIKMATGWERGADGKWRYEINDFDRFDPTGNVEWLQRHPEAQRYRYLLINSNAAALGVAEPLTEAEQKEFDKLKDEYKNYDFNATQKNKDNLTLKDFVEADELFKLYPELKDIKVKVVMGYNQFGVYRDGDREIIVHAENPREAEEVLTHEVQHAIQQIEGFAKGGSPKGAADYVKGMSDKAEVWTYSKEVENVAKELGTTSPYEIEKHIIEDMLGAKTPEAVEELEKEGWVPDSDGRAKGYNLWARGYDNEGYEEAYNNYYDKMRESGKASFWDGTPESLYARLAGEVEARNAARRRNMTAEERRNSLAEDTEDVAREDQIFLFGNGGESAMAVDNKSTERESDGTLFRSLNPESDNVIDNAEIGTRPLSDREKVAKLEAEPKVKVYRSMQLIDGELYPPMSAKSEGQLREPSEIGVWEEADERPDLADNNGKFTLNKGNGKSLKAAYNPYIHTSRTMLNDQFSEAQSRPNLVVVEMEVPESELTSDYKAEKAKDSVGAKQWKAGVIQGQLSGTREVILSRWAKPVRIVPDSEVAANIAEQIDGQVAVMPSNVVTPSVRAELEKLGVQFVETDNTGKLVDGPNKGKTWASVYGKKANNALMREGDNLPFINKTYEEGLAEARAAGYTKKQFDAMVERSERNARKRFADWAEKLNLTDKITFVDTIDELEGLTDKQREQRRDKKGWYDTKNDKIVIILDNHHTQDDVLKTILHEGVAHHGLRAMFGKAFDDFLDNVYAGAEYDIRLQIAKLAKNHGWNIRTATEEYLATLAENTEFESIERSPFAEWWSKIKHFFLDMLHKLGIKGAFAEGDNIFSDNELRYILWRSYQNLVNPGRYRSFVDTANDVVMQDKLKVGNYEETSGERGAWYAPAKAAEPGIDLDEVATIEAEPEMDGFVSGLGIRMTMTDGNTYKLWVQSGEDDGMQGVTEFYGDNEDGIPDEEATARFGKLFGEDVNTIFGSRIGNLLMSPRTQRNGITLSRDEIKQYAKAAEPTDNSKTLRDLKRENPDLLLLEDKGDHYEARGEDAKRMADILGVKPSNKGVVTISSDDIDNAMLRMIRGGLHVATYQNMKAAEDDVRFREGDGAMFREGDGAEDILNDRSIGLRERMTAAAARLAENNAGDANAKNALYRAIGGNLADLRKAMGIQKEFDKSTVKRVTDLAKILLQGGYLDGASRSEISRILSAVKNATGKADISGDIRKVMDIMVESQLRNAENALRDMEKIKASKVDAKGVEVQGALDVAGQQMLKTFKDTRGWSEDELSQALADAENRMASDDQAVADEAAAEYAGLQMAMDYVQNIHASKVEERELKQELDDARHAIDRSREYEDTLLEAIQQNKIERVQAYHDLMKRLGDTMRGSIEAAREFKEADKERVREIQHNANSDMEGRPSDEHYQPDFKDKFVNNSLVQFLFSPLSTFDQMLRLFGNKSANGEGYLYNRFMRGWVDAREKEIRGVRSKYAELDAKVKSLFGNEAKNMGELIRKIGSLPKMNVEFWDGGEMKEHTLTQGNLMYIYMVNKMLDGRMKLRKMGIDEKTVNSITRNLDPRLIELADWMQDEFLVNTRNEYNETHKRVFGAPMAAIENYFPLKILSNARVDKPEDLDNFELNDGISTKTGSIIKRRRNALALDIMGADALNVILDHVAQMEHWNAFAEYNRDLNTLRTYKRFRNQVKNMNTIYGSGDKLWQKFNDVAQMSAGSYRPKRANLDAAAVNFAKGVTAAKVSFRIFTALKQFLSMPAYIPDARPDLWAKNLATPWKSWNWAMENLPIFEERWKSRMAGDPRLMKSELDWKGWRNNVVQMASRIGMSPNAFVDALTVSIGARTIYETRKARYLKEGYSEEQADKRAKQDAEVVYNQTQQSSEGAFLSPMQVDRSWLSVMFTVFRNASMAYQRQLNDAIRNLKRDMKKGNKAESVDFMAKQMMREGVPEDKAEEAAKQRYNRQIGKDILRVATFGYILQLAWNLGAKLPYLLFGDDDDKKKEMMDDVWAQSMFGWGEGFTGGDVFSQAGKMAVQGKGNPEYLTKEMPITSDIKDVLQEVGNGKYGEVVNDMVNLAVQIGIGMNPQSITDAVLAVMDACGDDPALAHEAMIAVMRILQVPQSQIKEMYFDEVGLSGSEVSNYTPEQLARRYAEYKVKRGYFVTPWNWNSKGLIAKEQEKADKAIKERMGKAADTEVDEEYSRYQEQYKEFDQQLKDYRRTSEYKNATPMEKAELLSDYRQDNAEGYAQYDLFKSMDATLTKWSKYYLKANTDKESQVCKKAIEDYKKQMVAVMDATNDEQREAERKKLAGIIEGFYKEYGNLMSTRTQEEKLEREMDRALNKIDDAVDDANEVLNQ